jgi:hypothetical protein
MVACKILIIAIPRSTFYIKYLVWELLDIASGIFFSPVKYNCRKNNYFHKAQVFSLLSIMYDINTCIFYIMGTNAGINLTNFP